jgi:hypothetical protein
VADLSQYDSVFKAAGEEWNVDPTLLKAIATQESGGRTDAVSKAGAMGLMQIIPETQRYLGVTNPNDPVQSIYGAAKYVNEALTAEGTPERALLYYHGGPDWRNKYGPESAAYVPAVTAHYVKLNAAPPANQSLPAPTTPAPVADEATPVAPPKPVGEDIDAPVQIPPPMVAAAPAPTQEAAKPMATKPAGDTESDAEFLARTGGHSGGAESDEAFLKRTGATTGGPQTAEPGAPWEYVPPEAGDPDMTPRPSEVPATVAQARNALQPEPGYVRAGPLPFALKETSPGSGVADPNSGWAGFRWDPGSTVSALGGNALLDLLEGTGQATSMGGDAAPLAGKVSPEATAFMLGTRMGMKPRNALESGPRYGPSDSEILRGRVEEASRGGGSPSSGSSPGMDDGPTPGGAPGGPSPGMGGPGGGAAAPRSAGAAATPSGDATLTPEQAAEYGSVADKQWLYKSKPPGEADNTVYIKGIDPTMAQREQTIQAARETKAQRNLSPEAAQNEAELLDDHNTKRKNEYQEIAGSDVTQGNAIRAAEDKIDSALDAAYSKGGKVDGQPVAEAIQAELDAPGGKLPPVKAVMKEISDAMQKSDGSGLETDPRQWHGVRRVINFYQSKHGIAEKPAYGAPDVQAALIRVKDALDGAVEPAAPGFREAIADYATAKQAFDVNEALQKAEPTLYDSRLHMNFSKMHTFMNKVIQSRDPRASLNPWQSMTEEQLNRLKSLHDDLMRVATADDLAKARGSDTVPNFLDAVKSAAHGIPGTIAAGVAGHIFGGPGGAVVGPIIKGQVENIFTRGAERRATERMGNLLRPDPTKYPTRPNPLLNPDAPP